MTAIFSSLTWKQAFLALKTTLLFAVFIFVIEFIITVKSEQHRLKANQQQLIQRLEQVSLQDRNTETLPLAEKLVDLSLNLPWVKSVEVELSNGGRFFSANKQQKIPQSFISNTVASFVDEAETSTHLLYRTGLLFTKVSTATKKPFAKVTLSYDEQYISSQLTTHLKHTFLISLSGAFGLTVILAFVFHQFLTRPVVHICESMDRINPEAPKDSLLPRLVHHRKSELGTLVTKFNQILIQFDATQAKLRKLATKDTLTGLPNRTLLLETVQIAIQRAKNQRRTFAIFYIDLDRFKNINDSLGHDIGDRYLTRVARTLKRHTGEKGVVARLGGDEFAIVVNDIQDPNRAGEFARKLLEQIQLPLQLNGHELHPDAAVGIVLFPDDGHTAEDLIRRAETAMYNAKDLEYGNWEFFNHKMTENAVASLELEAELHSTIMRELDSAEPLGELQLFYQPKIDLTTGRVCGAEALIRWEKEGKLISPAKFIPIAEQSNLIIALGRWVIKDACRTIAHWSKSYNQVPKIAINVAARHFVDPNLIKQIKAATHINNIAPNLLEIEITEGSFINNIQLAIARIEQLQKAGFSVAIDDFGTGYSSLSYLKLLPISTLKIDRAFVEGLPENDAIAKTILLLGEQMNFDIVAEGIDEKKQLEWLKEHQCHIGQGFLFSKPLSKEEFENSYLSPLQNELEL
ncbi:EAL domain-containing protein [Shewanella sp. 202IG2-18]|uniref:putative bifunctional diguanylate cyclase/phosphodiesterase n=1 Tax=Parashewanella hymeniacidonis TaxID=2807618 RepID=UPI0019607FE0|nr:EAL domain-containing protein [Parashewanella hymeniacidonis]MBM7071664.1 EAL domain-containing protein [Parashewanella hymeniacidonis]